MKKNIELVPIDKIRIDIRDDINLRTYVLLNRARHIWLLFSRGLKEHGLNPKPYEQFLALYHDIRVNGMKEPIIAQKIDDIYYVEDGAHRLSIVRSLGMSAIDAQVVGPEWGTPSVFIAAPKAVRLPFPVDSQNPRIFQMFRHIPAHDIEKFSNLKLSSDIEKVPMRGAAVFWPPSNHLWKDLISEIKRFHEITNATEIECFSEKALQDITLELYKSDDVATHKVVAKFPYYKSVPWKFLLVEFNIEDARHRKKRSTGDDVSMAIEDLKGYIRSTYKSKIPNYPSSNTPDLLIHGGDNEHMAAEMLKVIEIFRDHNDVTVRRYKSIS